MSVSPLKANPGSTFASAAQRAFDFNTLVSGTAPPYINLSPLNKIPIVCSTYLLQCFYGRRPHLFQRCRRWQHRAQPSATTRDALLLSCCQGLLASGTFEELTNFVDFWRRKYQYDLNSEGDVDIIGSTFQRSRIMKELEL